MEEDDVEKELNEIFSVIGVGDKPIDKEFQAMQHKLDPDAPTLMEAEFARLVAKGVSRIQAYKTAFAEKPGASEMSYTQCEKAAAILYNRPRIQKKIYDLKRKMSEMMDETAENLIFELNSAMELAKAMGQPAVMVSAVKVKANILGLEQAKVVNNNLNIELNDEQKKAILGRMMGQIEEQEAIDAEFSDVTQKETKHE